MPSAITIRVWNFDHFNRSMRAGISVLIIDASLVAASLLTVRPFHERIRQCAETSPLGQRSNVLLSGKKVSTLRASFLITASKFLRTVSGKVNATHVKYLDAKNADYTHMQ
jgi:hypothetical protein